MGLNDDDEHARWAVAHPLFGAVHGDEQREASKGETKIANGLLVELTEPGRKGRVHKADGESENQLSTRPEWQVEFIQIMCWPDVNDHVETAVQGQDSIVLVSRTIANIALDGLVPVAVDGSGYLISIYRVIGISECLPALQQCGQTRPK